MQSYMITGDNHTTARIVAEQLGIHNVMAEVTPAGKAAKVIGITTPPTPYLGQHSVSPALVKQLIALAILIFLSFVT